MQRKLKFVDSLQIMASTLSYIHTFAVTLT